MSIVVGTVTGTASVSLILDLDALTARVAKLLRRSDIDTEIQQWINFAQRELTDDVKFPELRSTVYTTLVVNQYTYTIPSDYSREDRIYYLDTTASPTWGRNLIPLPRRMYADGIEKLLNISAPVTGDPMYYLVQGTDLYLYPAPNKAARIELSYYKVPTDMTQGVNVPSIDSRWRHYLIPLTYYWGNWFLEKEDANKMILWERKIKQVTGRVNALVTRKENKSLRGPVSTGLENADKVY